MVGKKMFFLKALLRSDRLRDQVSFDDFLATYTKEKLTAFANSDIHNDREGEKELSGILFKVEWSRDDAFFVREANEKMVESIGFEIREHDVLVRWSEDEFLLILPECSLESANKIAHLIKSIVEGKSFVNMRAKLDYAVTLHKSDDTPDSFTSRLEEQLHKEKAA
jgi:hypothetical protein